MCWPLVGPRLCCIRGIVRWDIGMWVYLGKGLFSFFYKFFHIIYDIIYNFRPSLNVANLLFEHGAMLIHRLSPMDTGLFMRTLWQLNVSYRYVHIYISGGVGTALNSSTSVVESYDRKYSYQWNYWCSQFIFKKEVPVLHAVLVPQINPTAKYTYWWMLGVSEETWKSDEIRKKCDVWQWGML